jgi:hypothetical protein
MKTAVEYLYTQLQMNNEILEKCTRVHQEMEDKIFEQAKEMEKKQAIEFGYDVADYLACGVFSEGEIEDRYNEFFKSEEQ